MKYVAIVLLCLLAGAVPSCFRPQLSCGRCGANDRCPSGLTCRSPEKLCVSGPREICASSLTMLDASPETATGGAGTATGGAGGMAGAEPVVPTGGGPGGAAGSRPVACTDHCCIDERCHPFPPTLQDGLLFWGDRTSMGEPGYALSAWLDRSKYANDIVPVNPGTPPRVQLYEGGAVVAITQQGMVIASKNAPATALGGDDFTILVLARCDVTAPRSCVFRQAQNVRPLKGVALYCNSGGESVLLPPYMNNRAELRVVDDNVYMPGDAATVVSRRTDLNGGMHLFGARRVGGTRLQLRVDGVPEGEIPIPAELALAYQSPIYVGSCAPAVMPSTLFIGELGAAVVVHGNLSEEEVHSLETFLLTTSAAAP